MCLIEIVVYMYIDTSLEKIHGSGTMYVGMMGGHSFGAEKSMC